MHIPIDVAVLLDDSLSHRASTTLELREWHDVRIKSVFDQIALPNDAPSSSSTVSGGGGRNINSEEARRRGMSSSEALKKRAEREAMRAARLSALAEMKKNDEDAPGALFVPDEDGGPLLDTAPAAFSSVVPAVIPVMSDPTIPSNSSAIAAASTMANAQAPAESLQHHTVHIPSTSDSLPWYNPTRYDTLSAASEAGIWTFPSTQEERARCAVFRALSERGYYMGGGLKFGGDWLVYPGSCSCLAFVFVSVPLHPLMILSMLLADYL